MKNFQKTILIKSTSTTGSSMINNAEYHTLIYFCKWLSNDNKIIVSGIEYQSSIFDKLKRAKVFIKEPFFKYLFLKKLKVFLHIPVSILNTFVDAYTLRPDLLICLGGVFYNGLAVVIAGKILGIKTLVRSAEDHIAIANHYKINSIDGLYARLRAYLSGITIRNSDYFLTVGDWSENYFINTYKLSKENTFMIPGPIDNSICFKKEFLKTAIESKNYLVKKYSLSKKNKIILFIGSSKYKGLREILELCEIIKNEKLSVNIIWITNSKKINKKVIDLKFNNFVNIIEPVNRNELVNLLKGVDFLFWSASLGVGYGQIMLESILCNTEILCFNPIGDAKYLVKDKYYSSFEEVIKRITNKLDQRNIKIPDSMKEELLKNKHLNMIKNILKN